MRTRIISIIIIIVSVVSFVGALFFFDRQLMAKKDNADLDWFKKGRTSNRSNFFEEDFNKEIIVGIYNAGYLYHDGHDHGINSDIVDELFSRLELKYRIVIMPRVRASSMIAEGSLPVGVSTIKTDERAEFSFFVPYFAQKNDVLIRSNSNIETEEELFENKNLKVGIIRGYYYGEYYEQLIEKLKEEGMVVEAKDAEHLYKMLKNNWIQVTFNNATSYQFYFDFYDIGQIGIYDWAPEEKPLVRNLVFSKKFFTAQDVEVFQQTIEQMIEDGTVYRIFNSYLSKKDIERTCSF